MKTEKIEYMVNIYGGMWNKDANPSIEKDLGIKKGAHYFETESEMNDFLDKIRNPIYSNQGFMYRIESGILKHKRTIYVGKYKYNDKKFTLRHDLGYDFPEDRAKFLFTGGNYACDCNISILAREQYGNDFMPELECGNAIELLKYHIEYED